MDRQTVTSNILSCDGHHPDCPLHRSRAWAQPESYHQGLHLSCHPAPGQSDGDGRDHV